jgi:hypothetical protein
LLEVLLQAVGKHLRPFRQPRRLAGLQAGWRTSVPSGCASRRSPVTNWSGCTLNSSSLHGKAPFQNAYCLWLRMPMRLPSSGAPVNTALPAHAGLAQALAEVLVEVQQAGFVTQTLAVGRVADHQAFLVLVRARLEGATSPW